MEMFIAMAVKPFVALAVLLFARWLGYTVCDKLPDGWLKRLLLIRW